MSEATCKTCPWWDMFDEFGSGRGFCRVNPPETWWDDGIGEWAAKFPAPRGDVWCGEHPGRAPQMAACVSSAPDIDIDALADRVLGRLHREMRAR